MFYFIFEEFEKCVCNGTERVSVRPSPQRMKHGEKKSKRKIVYKEVTGVYY